MKQHFIKLITPSENGAPKTWTSVFALLILLIPIVVVASQIDPQSARWKFVFNLIALIIFVVMEIASIALLCFAWSKKYYSIKYKNIDDQ